MVIYMLTTVEAMAAAKMFTNQTAADKFTESMEERETITGVMYYVVKDPVL